MAVAKEMIAGGARLIQYRDKVSEPGRVYSVCERLRPVLRRADALFIVNDYPDIAVAVGADGVHVGVDDLPVAACRRVVGDELLQLPTLGRLVGPRAGIGEALGNRDRLGAAAAEVLGELVAGHGVDCTVGNRCGDAAGIPAPSSRRRLPG